MASLTKLRRRALRWRRYGRAIGWRFGRRAQIEYVGGFNRAHLAVKAEEERRFWDEPEPTRPVETITVGGGLL